MQIQRIALVKNPEFPAPWSGTSWALVDGPIAIRPAFEIPGERCWVVCHVPSGLYLDVVGSKEDARSLAAALQGVLPATGTLGVNPPLEYAAPVRKVLLNWRMAQVW